jgi:hypothetical protein
MILGWIRGQFAVPGGITFPSAAGHVAAHADQAGSQRQPAAY